MRGLEKLFDSSTFWMSVLGIAANVTLGIPLEAILAALGVYGVKESAAKVGDGLAKRGTSDN